jgi:hypothetical protein
MALRKPTRQTIRKIIPGRTTIESKIEVSISYPNSSTKERLSSNLSHVIYIDAPGDPAGAADAITRT